MKRKFIINPHSGGVTKNYIQDLESYFRDKIGEFNYVLTKSREDTILSTRQALKEGVEQVIAVGGDGTINAVVNGFFEKGKPLRPESSLAISKAGTGSDYYKCIDPQRKVDWREIVIHHEICPVDLGLIKYQESSYESQYFINISSMGITSEVAKKRNEMTWLPSFLQYLLPACLSILSYRSQKVNLTFDKKEDKEEDEEKIEEEAFAIFVGKGIYSGKGMRWGGEVTLSDGLLDVTVLREAKARDIPRMFYKLYFGKGMKGDKLTTKLTTARVQVKTTSPLLLEMDGELYGTTDLEISVVPKSIFVCFPCQWQ